MARSLLEEITEVEGAASKGPDCTIAVLLEELPKADAEDLRAVLANKSVKGTHIAKALRNRSYVISDHTIQRHRRDGCQCKQRSAESDV